MNAFSVPGQRKQEQEPLPFVIQDHNICVATFGEKRTKAKNSNTAVVLLTSHGRNHGLIAQEDTHIDIARSNGVAAEIKE